MQICDGGRVLAKNKYNLAHGLIIRVTLFFFQTSKIVTVFKQCLDFESTYLISPSYRLWNRLTLCRWFFSYISLFSSFPSTPFWFKINTNPHIINLSLSELFLLSLSVCETMDEPCYSDDYMLEVYGGTHPLLTNDLMNTCFVSLKN